ncbi:unnamed protein product [Amoebophrya sp. A25]|nr:unnamed protein product [Amoebophrya sp. A25]|eukprot:GSA25T00000422001.1
MTVVKLGQRLLPLWFVLFGSLASGEKSFFGSWTKAIPGKNAVQKATEKSLEELFSVLTSKSSDTAKQMIPEFRLVNLMEGVEQNPKEGKTPIVFMHGMGDSGSNPGMQNLCKTTAATYQTYVVCLDVADGMSSIFTKMETQLEELARVVKSDPKLRDGFNMMGNSQGGLMSRAYIERYNDPPVKVFVSNSGPQNGIQTCPTGLSWACPLLLRFLNPYTTPLVFSDYWRDSSDRDKFLCESRFLADVGNERTEKNTTYADNMKKLKRYMLLEANEDSMVIPHASESHGFYKWGSTTELEDFHDSESYKGDWLGLRTLDEAGKLEVIRFEGDHMRIPHDVMHEKVLPLLGGKIPVGDVNVADGSASTIGADVEVFA